MSTVVVGVLVVCSGAVVTIRHGAGVPSADAVSRPVRRVLKARWARAAQVR
jgi:hypothetical protein